MSKKYSSQPVSVPPPKLCRLFFHTTRHSKENASYVYSFIHSFSLPSLSPMMMIEVCGQLFSSPNTAVRTTRSKEKKRPIHPSYNIHPWFWTNLIGPRDGPDTNLARFFSPRGSRPFVHRRNTAVGKCASEKEAKQNNNKKHNTKSREIKQKKGKIQQYNVVCSRI